MTLLVIVLLILEGKKMTSSNSNQTRNRVFVSEEGLYPKSIISENYYTNSVRLGFIMLSLESNKSIQFTPIFLRLLLNLYLSPKKLWKTSIVLGLKTDYIPTRNDIEAKASLSSFYDILGLLLAKGLLSLDKKNSTTEQPVFKLKDKFQTLLKNFNNKNLEPNIIEKLELIKEIMSSWDSDDFIEFIKEELKDLI